MTTVPQVDANARAPRHEVAEVYPAGAKLVLGTATVGHPFLELAGMLLLRPH